MKLTADYTRPTAISFMGFSILSVLRQEIILCKGKGRGVVAKVLKNGTWGTRQPP